MHYTEMSPMVDTYDKMYTIYGALIDLGKCNLARLVLRNRNYKKLERYARFVRMLAVKQNRNDLVTELEFAGLIYS